MATLIIKDLHAEVEGKEILKGVNLTVNTNETIALLGPNGHGKSTLLNVIMGHPKYVVTQGSITFDGVDILSKTTDERARMGLFLAMQNPSEVPGVINSDFLRAAINAKAEKPISTYKFYKMLDNATKEVKSLHLKTLWLSQKAFSLPWLRYLTFYKICRLRLVSQLSH